jgi:putative oxidoreductase
MSSTFVAAPSATRPRTTAVASRAANPAITLLGRILFTPLFLMSGFTHFQPAAVQYAAQAGVPFPGLLVPASGILAAIGGLSIATGYRARLGAWMIVAFLVPVTLSLHAFWNVSDPMMQQVQMAMFLKNVAMLGGALLITQFGAGPLSFDARRQAGVSG